MDHPLSEFEAEQYRLQGVVFPIPVLTSDEAQLYRTASDSMEAGLGGRPRTVDVRQMHLHLRWAYELAIGPKVLDAVECILGPNLLIWATELFAKHPFDDGVAIAWHRDKQYMGFDTRLTTTAWISLGQSRVANGCMMAMPEPESARRAATYVPPSGEEPDGDLIDVELGPGEMSLHDGDVLHGSRPNRSEEKRVGFVIRYITPDAAPPHGRPPVLLARGVNTSDRFEIVDPPREQTLEEALAGMKLSAADHLQSMLETLKRTS